MEAARRQREIAELTRIEGFASVERLAERYGVSPQTIRRDINLLCDRGVVRRLRGGAGMPAIPDETANIAYDTRQVMNLNAKRRIAALVAERIPDGSSISIGIGTTPEQVAVALAQRSGLAVVTNNMNAAMVLCRNETNAVTIVGGRLRNRDRDVTGDPAVAVFATFRVDFAVFGVGGIDDDGGLLDFDSDEVRTRAAMAANARSRLLVADRSKFGRNAFARGGNLAEMDALFTDGPVPPGFAAMVAASGVDLNVAPASETP